MRVNLFKKKQKDKLFLTLDIGTEAVKALIFSRGSRGQKEDSITILGVGLAYFDKFDVFDSGRFETDVIRKTINKAIESAKQSLSRASIEEELKQRVKKQKKCPAFLMGLPPDILKARIASQSFSRDKPRTRISKREEQVIQEHIFESAKTEISDNFVQEFGILPNEICWISLKVIGIKIDGYPVLNYLGYQGKNLEFEILITFLPKYYLENMKRIISFLKFKTMKIVHIAEGLLSMSENKKNGIFLDVGDQMTQILGVRNGQLKEIDEFQGGGKAFIQSLSQRLGIDENRAREMTERYLKKDLEPDTLERLKEIFSWERKIWYDNLKDKLDKLNLKSFTIFLFGGASSLPEIQSVLEENSLKTEFISIKDFDNVIDATKVLDDPQYIPGLLICNCI